MSAGGQLGEQASWTKQLLSAYCVLLPASDQPPHSTWADTPRAGRAIGHGTIGLCVRVCPLINSEASRAETLGLESCVPRSSHGALPFLAHPQQGWLARDTAPQIGVTSGPCRSPAGCVPPASGATPSRRGLDTRPDSQQRLRWRSGAGPCDLNLRGPPHYVEEKVCFEPTYLFHEDDRGRAGRWSLLGHLGCCGRRCREQLCSRGAGRRGWLCEGTSPGRVPGCVDGAEAAVPGVRCGSSSADRGRKGWAVSACGWCPFSAFGPIQSLAAEAGRGAGRKEPLLGRFLPGRHCLVRLRLSEQPPLCLLPSPRELFCEMSVLQNFSPFVCFIVRGHKRTSTKQVSPWRGCGLVNSELLACRPLKVTAANVSLDRECVTTWSAHSARDAIYLFRAFTHLSRE